MEALTSGSSNLAPDVSADGAHIAFTSDRTGNDEIWEMNADGSDPVQVTHDGASDYYPTFSPDGTQIAYRMTTSSNPGDIFVIASDGGATPTQLTTAPGLDSAPEWSPDGSTILFHSSRDDANPATCTQCVQSIYSTHPDGSSQTRLVYVAGERNRFPNWSPDGSRIVFERDSSTDASGTGEIYTANADGSNPTLFAPTSGASNDEAPDFSPDGTQLAWDANGHLQTAPLSSTGTPITIDTQGVVVGSVDWSVTPTITLTSATTVSSSPTSSVYGQRVVFTAKVASAGGVTAAPTGTVTFSVNGTQIGKPVTVSHGVAKLAASSAPAGSDTIVAKYSGDGQHTASRATAQLQVSQAQTTTTPSVANGATITYGQPVTATIKTVAPSTAGIPASATGAIAYIDGTSTGSLRVTSAKATVPVALLTAGSHSVQICYQGTSNLASSCSSTINITVDQAATTTTLTSSANPATVGQKVTLTAKVAPRTTGTVTFYDDSTPIGQANLSYGAARITVRFSTADTHPISATFNGNDNLLSSTSNTISEQVN
ncbi:Ig-like domain repeat protein [uncultured Jatrophihabitans sp.]|uniref:Ig-like domain repeat protein n=1 Tax=uncultured Jatrophihabitans sp. TaxID=1610747 RepID=UPI0035CA7DC0